MSPKDWWLKVVKRTFEDSLNDQDRPSGPSEFDSRVVFAGIFFPSSSLIV
jgi:hypothetical protein